MSLRDSLVSARIRVPPLLYIGSPSLPPSRPFSRPPALPPALPPSRPPSRPPALGPSPTFSAKIF
jgi:hypothetical protein